MSNTFEDSDDGSCMVDLPYGYLGEWGRTGMQEEDIIEGMINPPTQVDLLMKKKYPSVRTLFCVFLGTTGKEVWISSIEKVIAWFTKSCTTTPNQQVMIGIDTETGSKGGVGLLQVKERDFFLLFFDPVLCSKRKRKLYLTLQINYLQNMYMYSSVYQIRC